MCHVKTNGCRNFSLEEESFSFFLYSYGELEKKVCAIWVEHPSLVTQVYCTGHNCISQLLGGN